MSTELDKEAQMWRVALQDAEGSQETVDPDVVWAAVRGDLRADELAVLVDRLATDADLQVAWRLAAELQREAVPIAVPVVPQPVNRAWIGGLALVAVVLLGVLVVSLRPVDTEEVRGDSGIVTVIADRAVLPRAEFVLQWSQPQNAVATVEVRGADLSLVARSPQISGGEWQVPPEALADVASGQELVWRVSVRAEGATQTSSAFVVRVGD